MSRHNFRNLKVYQRAIEFAVEIYKLSKTFPKEELYGLTSQIRRAVTSISLNIAEGSANNSEKEFKRFLGIALQSDYEVMSCLEIALRLSYCERKGFDRLIAEANEIAAMIAGLSKSLSSRLLSLVCCLLSLLCCLSSVVCLLSSSALAKDMDQAIVHYNQGYAYYKKGEYDAAIEELNKSLQFDPENENAFYGLGNCYYRKQLYEKAIEAYKEAVSKNEDFANAHYGLGTAYSALRKTDEADKEFTIYRRLKTGQTRITGAISPADQGAGERGQGAGGRGQGAAGRAEAESKEGKTEKPSSKIPLSEPEARQPSISVPRQEEAKYPGPAPEKWLKNVFSIMAIKAPKNYLNLIAALWNSSCIGKIIIGIIGYLVLTQIWLAMVAFQGLVLWRMRGKDKR